MQLWSKCWMNYTDANISSCLLLQEKFLELFCREAYASAFLDHKNQVAYNHLGKFSFMLDSHDSNHNLQIITKFVDKFEYW